MSNLPKEQSTSRKSSGMNLSDIAMLLGFVGIYDLRIQVDELKVRAWKESLDWDIPLDEAKKIVSAHYANFDTAINPSHINRAWRTRVASEIEKKRGKQISDEIENAKQQAASQEIADMYLTQIRSILNRGKSEMEVNSEKVASDE